VQDIIEKGEAWTDPDFKPCLDSLCFDGTPAQFEKCAQYEWQRGSEIFSAPKLFSEGISPSDIN
jgi:hypothetical protein